MKKILIILAIIILAVLAYCYLVKGNHTENTKTASVFILEPGDNTTVSSPVTIKFGASNVQILPAGENVPNSGHHHLLVDLSELPDLSQALPATDNIMHFGQGQTETTLELSPGTHTLQLVLADYQHVPHVPSVTSKAITITVE